MQRLTDEGMAALGGTRAVAEMLDAPASTVQSFKDRITRSRVNHLKLAAAAKGKEIDWDRALEPVGEHDGHGSASPATTSPGKIPEISGAAA